MLVLVLGKRLGFISCTSSILLLYIQIQIEKETFEIKK